ncbi:MAG: hypothetical protein IJF94_05535 [Eubacterium sp.]|nr:hypothetical protein [Eubacterium sp.]
MGKGIILGIDFSLNFTQIAYLDGDGVPQTITFGDEGHSMIPSVVCYNKDVKEWYSGEEAIERGRLAHTVMYKELPNICSKKMNEDKQKVIMSFMKYVLDIACASAHATSIRDICISVDDLNPKITENLKMIFEMLGYQPEQVRIISHTESFVYYILNQNKDIWINKVYFINFDRYDFSCRKLNVMKGREPFVADVKIEDLDEIKKKVQAKMPFAPEGMLTNDAAEMLDGELADYLADQVKRHVVSGIFLSGQGFKNHEWPKTVEAIAHNRRVFQGDNLIVRGATHAAREFFHIPHLDHYLISCKGRTRVKITMNVKHRERDNTITLSNIGDYWYNARSRAECIMDEPCVADFSIHDIINQKTQKFQVDLTKFPQRPPKTTRLEVNFRYTKENEIEIEIKDLGFGEFFEATNKKVKKKVTIE